MKNLLMHHVCLLVLFIVLLVQACVVGALPQVDWPGQASVWHGYQRYTFEHQGRSAFVTTPNHPAPGKPWVWRARFPEYHPEVDLILLERGFHIAYLNTDNLFGNEQALDLWDGFYDRLIELGLHPRPALEGVSRGGLFVYGWVARHPERVACIYADTPVCDVRSWPVGVGDEATPAFLKAYGLTREEALTYTDSPIHKLKPLAKAGVPLMHIITRNDAVVPPKAHTDVLAQRYRALGGSIEVIELAEGPRFRGHHFDHPDPRRCADFIERHTAALPSTTTRDYHTLRNAMDNSRRTFEQTGKGTVAFLGGSITYGGGWREHTMAYLQERFPKTEFTFINAGIPSTGSTPGAFRIGRDVLDRSPIDLLFVEAAVNDAINGRSSDEITRGMEGEIVQVRRQSPTADIVMLHFVDPRKIETYQGGAVPQVIELHKAVAEHYGVPTIDLAREVSERIADKQFTWQEDFIDLHPSPFGHRLYASAIRRLLASAWPGERLPADAQPSPHAMPDAPLDASSYTHAGFKPLADAKALRGFTVQKNVDPRANDVGGGVRGGFVNVDMLVGTEPGDQFSLPFTGRAVGLFVAAGPDAGTIEYRIDPKHGPRGQWQTLDLFTQWSGGLHLPWAHVLAGDLEPGDYTLTVRIVKERNPASKGHACRIVHLLVNE